MIILMITLCNTIHLGDNVYYDVSETTWQCYCKFIRWIQDECHTQNDYHVTLMFQGGWGVKIDG